MHHGNGNEAIFLNRPDVLAISLHQENCFPIESGAASQRGEGPGRGFNLNVPLLPGGGDQAYRDLFDLLALPMLDACKPELIIVVRVMSPTCSRFPGVTVVGEANKAELEWQAFCFSP